ncbi:hypothetical protein FACS1894116_14040 [Betaproteobacteria bacterium]|nr:hypothetical protein FACS1894116_14040 [Betaproteobacteria bacterium]GHU29390.1 hypothetical protein FACS189497_07280 [Betaproteobacteria bacterium]
MDQHSYYVLVKRLELDASVSPALYRTKVLLISSAAYVVLFGVLFTVAVLLYLGATRLEQGASATARLALLLVFMGPTFFVVFRMFFMRLPPPEGRYIEKAEAPVLFGVLDKLRKRLNGPPIHRVLVNTDFNASISQRPRWGLFGGHTNYLTLGLPFMLGMTSEEMLAIVAHEYGHVCGNHGKTSAWVYRQRLTFGALYDQVVESAEDNLINRGIAWLLQGFMPYYNAYTFVLSREDEYEADRTATEMVGGEVNAQGLIRGELLGRWIQEEFWPKLYQQADSRDKPAFMPFGSMRSAFKAAYPEWATGERLAAAWRVRSDLHDTHPALRERVDAIGAKEALPRCVDKTAADVLLGATAKLLMNEFDRHWWEDEMISATTIIPASGSAVRVPSAIALQRNSPRSFSAPGDCPCPSNQSWNDTGLAFGKPPTLSANPPRSPLNARASTLQRISPCVLLSFI